MKSLKPAAGIMALLASAGAQAHSFGQVYTLPVPFRLYAWASVAALLLSFLVAARFLSRAQAERSPRLLVLPAPPVLLTGALLALLRVGSVGTLLLCIAAGFAGPADPFLNLGMTLFWIGFVLAFAYLALLLGDLYALINPWRALVDCLGRLHDRLASRTLFRGRLRRPERLGHWPALLLYMGFIGIELFSHGSPRSLAALLLAYTGINLAGAWLLGARAWFRQGECFSVLLRLLGRMAPLAWLPPDSAIGHGRLVLRLPFSGLRQGRAGDLGELLFILFMLSATAFDGLHVTEPWRKLFWQDGFALLAPWLGDNIVSAWPVMRRLHMIWEIGTLLLSPLLYLAPYLLCLALARRLAGSGPSLRELALRFAWTLLPIALVYHVSHYYTLVLTQGPELPRLLADPLGRGWQLFTPPAAAAGSRLPDMNWIWHTQVGLILAGHMVSVHLAHAEALRCFGTPRRALLSQLPMLALMMAFTVFGLWIIAQPLADAG